MAELLGVEVEYFHDLLYRSVADVLVRSGVVVHHSDMSVDGEYALAEPVRLGEELPYLLMLWPLRRWFDPRYRSTGNHIHYSRSGWSPQDVIETHNEFVELVPYVQPFFAMRVYRVDDELVVEWSTERRRWADVPAKLNSYCCVERNYWAVTPNFRGKSTVEIRLCETYPLFCVAGLHLILAMLRTGETPGTRVDYYQRSIPVRVVERLVEIGEDGGAPRWALRLAMMLARGVRDPDDPEFIVSLLSRSEAFEALKAIMTRLTIPWRRVRIGNLTVQVMEPARETPSRLRMLLRRLALRAARS